MEKKEEDFSMSAVFDLLIIFRNGNMKIVKKVSDYGVKGSIFYYEKHDYTSFVPVESVDFFGRLFDFEEE